MNFPTNKPSQGGVGNAGAVGFGEPGAASAQLSVGVVGFGPHWSNTEDSMAASIIRMEQENQELRAEVALAEAERIEMAKMLRSEREGHAQCQNERDAARKLAESAMFEADKLRGQIGGVDALLAREVAQ